MGATFIVQELDKLSMSHPTLPFPPRLILFTIDENADRYW